MTEVEIFTDGACKGNPGPGGWGVLLRILARFDAIQAIMLPTLGEERLQDRGEVHAGHRRELRRAADHGATRGEGAVVGVVEFPRAVFDFSQINSQTYTPKDIILLTSDNAK